MCYSALESFRVDKTCLQNNLLLCCDAFFCPHFCAPGPGFACTEKQAEEGPGGWRGQRATSLWPSPHWGPHRRVYSLSRTFRRRVALPASGLVPALTRQDTNGIRASGDPDPRSSGPRPPGPPLKSLWTTIFPSTALFQVCVFVFVLVVACGIHL